MEYFTGNYFKRRNQNTRSVRGVSNLSQIKSEKRGEY